jgi:hypothetical protein
MELHALREAHPLHKMKAKRKRRDAWDVVKNLREEEWTVEDWRDFYQAIDRAMKKIAARHTSNSDSTTPVA